MPSPQAPEGFLIQIDRPSQQLDMAAIQTLLEGTGVELDSTYGPVCINPKLGRFLVRGVATPEARARAEQIPGIRFFADPRIAPTESEAFG